MIFIYQFHFSGRVAIVELFVFMENATCSVGVYDLFGGVGVTRLKI